MSEQAKTLLVTLALCLPYIAWQAWLAVRARRALRDCKAMMARAKQLPPGDPERIRLMREVMARSRP